MTPRFESFVVNRLIVLRKARHASFYFSGLKSCKLLLYRRIFTNEECADIVLAEISEDKEKLHQIYEVAKGRLQQTVRHS